MSENNMVTIGETELTLADLAGIDLSDVKEVRSTVTPAGKYHWRIEEAKMESKEIPLDYEDPTSEKITIPVFSFELKAQNCYSLVDPDLDIEDQIGIVKYHSFRIKDLKKDLGQLKAFLVDIGLEGNKKITDLMDEAHGQEFVSDITNKPNPDNPDFIYANVRKVITLEEFAETQAE